MTKKFASLSLFLLPLLFVGLMAVPSAAQVSGQNTHQRAEDLPGLVAEAISVIVEEVKQDAPADAITEPVVLDLASLKPVLSKYAGESFSPVDFAEAVRSAYKHGAATAERPRIFFSSSSEVDSVSNPPGRGEKRYSLADAGMILWLSKVTLAGEGAEIEIGAHFNEPTPKRGGTGLVLRMSLVRENGQWQAKIKKVMVVVP